MPVCKACNTRFESGTACPSCGRKVDPASDTGSAAIKASPPPLPLRPVEAKTRAEEDALDLDEAAVVDAEVDAVLQSDAPEAPLAPARRRAAASPMQLDAAQVRALVAEQPGLVEKGLGIHSDESGKPVGVDFGTPVGDIDVLARDRSGALVVIMIPDPPDVAQVVAEVVQRIGWTRKHVASDRQEVRGIVVVDKLPEEVSYAAAGVAGSVSFKSYRVSLSFDDLSV